MLGLTRINADCRPPLSRCKSLNNNQIDSLKDLQMESKTPTPQKKSLKQNKISLSLTPENDNTEAKSKSAIYEKVCLEMKELRSVLLSNLNLVEQQEKMLAVREKEISGLKRDNKTLRCRLERMERRLTLKSAPSPLAPATPVHEPKQRESAGKSLKRKSDSQTPVVAKKPARNEYEREFARGSGQRALAAAASQHQARSTPDKRATPISHKTSSGSSTSQTPHSSHSTASRRRVPLKRKLATNFDASSAAGSPKPDATPAAVTRNRSAAATANKHSIVTPPARRAKTIQNTSKTAINNSSSSPGGSCSNIISSRRISKKQLKKIPKHDTILTTSVQYYVASESSVRVHGAGASSDDTCVAMATEIECKPPAAAAVGASTSSAMRAAEAVDSDKNKEHVLVPSFRIKTYVPFYGIDGRENFEDEVYIERHRKPENEEKKRKRWDLQQQREEQARRKLLSSNRYSDHIMTSHHHHHNTASTSSPLKQQQEANNNNNHKQLAATLKAGGAGGGGGSGQQPCVTLDPDPNNIEFIEVCDELPVAVFGFPLPPPDASEFTLPWFKVDKAAEKPAPKRSRGKKR